MDDAPRPLVRPHGAVANLLFQSLSLALQGIPGLHPGGVILLSRASHSDERANRQTGQSEFLERANRAARPPARAAQKRRAGGAALRIAAREQRAGPDA